MPIYYDPGKAISYNALLNFLIGPRGVGKTYGIKKFSINDFLKHDNQWAYIRRYKSEIEKIDNYFDALIRNDEYPDHALEVKKDKFIIDQKTAGWAIPLSTAKILKSSEFAGVKNIIYDEFLIDKGTHRYLRNEVFDFLDIIETLARLRDVRVFLLANAISTSNPYFDFFHIKIPKGCKFKTFKDGLILYELINNPEYEQAKRASRFGRLVEGTAYGDYAIKNQFLRDSSCFIRKKTGPCKHWSTIVYGQLKIGVWIQTKTKELYLSKDYDPTNPCFFSADIYSHDEHTMLIKARTSIWFKPLVNAYQTGTLFFEDQQIKQTISGLLEKCLNS